MALSKKKLGFRLLVLSSFISLIFSLLVSYFIYLFVLSVSYSLSMLI